MNFLSHFYFDRNTLNEHIVLGGVLPDLLKNANKTWNAHPNKFPELFMQTPFNHILKGWNRHLEVDLIFHSSPFFIEKMADIKQYLTPILNDSPVRPSFLAHISIELLLDHLLIDNRLININHFYQSLNSVSPNHLQAFLKNCNINDFDRFYKFFTNFIASKYLLSYQKIENITYALQRICMRLWDNPFSETTALQITKVLEMYKLNLKEDFIIIFDQIENRLSKNHV